MQPVGPRKSSVIKKEGFKFFSGDSIDSDRTSDTEDEESNSENSGFNNDLSLPLDLSVTRDFTEKVLTYREECLNKDAAAIDTYYQSNSDGEGELYSSDSTSDSVPIEDAALAHSQREGKEASEVVAWTTPRRDNSTDLSERQRRSAASRRRLDEMLLPKAEKITVEEVDDFDLEYLEVFATPRHPEKDLGAVDNGNNIQTSPIIASSKEVRTSNGEEKTIVPPLPFKKSPVIPSLYKHVVENHSLHSAPVENHRPMSAPVVVKKKYFESGRNFSRHNYRRPGRNMGIFHNRVSSLQQSIKPNGIGSPEFQKRLVEAAENVVANEESGPIGASSNGGLASPAGETSAQVRMEDLQYHMARMLFQLNECRNFHEEKDAHGKADISHPFLDKLNKRMKSVSITEPKSPRTIFDNNNECPRHNHTRTAPVSPPPHPITNSSSQKNSEGSRHNHTQHAPVPPLPHPIINSSSGKISNGDGESTSSEASIANNVHTLSSTNFVASRRSKTFEPNKLKKKKQKVSRVEPPSTTAKQGMDSYHVVESKTNGPKEGSEDIRKASVAENSNITFKKKAPKMLRAQQDKESLRLLKKREGQLKHTKLKRHMSNVNGSENPLRGRRLEYIRLLGRGASAKVYLAKLFSSAKDKLPTTSAKGQNFELIAVKQLQTRGGKQGSVDEIGRVLRLEVETLRGLSHRNIVSYRGMHFSRRRKEYHILMEYVDGGSLADAVKRFPNGIQHNELVRIVTQIVDGLAYLHSQRVIHRDLKPANILFSKKGVVKIADFDISTQVCGLNTKQRSCVGTPWYTAPEVILVEPYSYSADIWSLGCTVFQLATGTCPYEGYGAVQAMFQIVHSGCPKYPAHATIREDLRDFTDQCFARDPKCRSTAVQLREHHFLCGNWTAKLQSSTLSSSSKSDDDIYSSDFDDEDSEEEWSFRKK